MGGGNSKILAERATLSKSDTEIVNLMLPGMWLLYYYKNIIITINYYLNSFLYKRRCN